MSGTDTAAAPAPEPAPPEPEYRPSHVLSSDPEPSPEPEKKAEPEPDPEPEPAKPPEKTAEQKREDYERRRTAQILQQRYAEKARADAAEARLREIEARGQPEQPDIERLASQRAEQILQQREQEARQREHAARFDAWDAAGQKEYGEAFRDSCKTVGQMATPEQAQALVAIALDLDGGAGSRAIMELASDPEETEKILAMPPHRMALALAKMAAAAPPAAPPAPPKPVSRAPAPIPSPDGGRARGDPSLDGGSMDEYMRASAKIDWSRR